MKLQKSRTNYNWLLMIGMMVMCSCYAHELDVEGMSLDEMQTRFNEFDKDVDALLSNTRLFFYDAVERSLAQINKINQQCHNDCQENISLLVDSVASALCEFSTLKTDSVILLSDITYLIEHFSLLLDKQKTELAAQRTFDRNDLAACMANLTNTLQSFINQSCVHIQTDFALQINALCANIALFQHQLLSTFSSQSNELSSSVNRQYYELSALLCSIAKSYQENIDEFLTPLSSKFLINLEECIRQLHASLSARAAQLQSTIENENCLILQSQSQLCQKLLCLDQIVLQGISQLVEQYASDQERFMDALFNFCAVISDGLVVATKAFGSALAQIFELIKITLERCEAVNALLLI